MKNFVQKGDMIHTVLEDGIKGGDLVVLGDVIGVAVTDGDGTNLNAVQTSGVFELPKASGAIEQGAKVYFVEAEGNISTTEENNVFAGYAWNEALDADETVNVKIG